MSRFIAVLMCFTCSFITISWAGAPVVVENFPRSKPLYSQLTVTMVKVDKSVRRMYLMSGDTLVREYRIALGKQPKGHKRFEGDNRTPEGRYYLDYVLEESEFYRSVHISYPGPSDRKWAEKYDIDPGGNIKIHGLKNGERRSSRYVQSFDWTGGCIAITNQEMDEFIDLVRMGTPIIIEW